MTYQELIDRSVVERGHPRKYGSDRIKGYVQHHIIPKCMNGKNNGENIAYLTESEHLMAHVLLFRENPSNYGIASAAFRMSKEIGIKLLLNVVDNEDEFNCCVADVVKAREIAYSRENHPMFGKHPSEETRKLWSIQRKGKYAGINAHNIRAVVSIKVKTGDVMIFNFAKEASDKLGISQDSISMCCSGKRKTAGGYQWMFYDEWENMSDDDKILKVEYAKTYKRRPSKPWKIGEHTGKDNPAARSVICIDTGKVFDTIKEAGEYYHINSGSIVACVNNRSNSADGYRWMGLNEWNNLTDSEKEVAKSIRIGSGGNGYKKVICIETNVVFDSVSEASKKTNTNVGSICNCCKGKQKTANNYHWMYYDEYLANKK